MPKRRRYFQWFTLLYLGILLGCVFHASRMMATATGSPPLRVVLFGQDEAERTTDYRDGQTERSAAFARAGIYLATLLYLLGMGLLGGPRPLKLLCGNLLVLVFILLGLEVALRVLNVHFPAVVRRDPSDRNLWVYDSTKGWFHRPNETGAVPMGGPDQAMVRINSLGLRGGDIPSPKPPGVKRVLVVGDSFVFGLGVDEDHLFTTHLESFLDRLADDTYEVINMGVLGYSTDQEYVLLQELGMKLTPDLVILVVCDNDFLYNTYDFVYRRYFKPYFELDPRGALALRNTPVPLLSHRQRLKLFLGQESTLWNFVRSRNPTGPSIEHLVNLFQVGVPRPSTVDPVEITAALVLAFRERVEAAGARLLVINTGHRGENVPLFHALRPKLEDRGVHQLGLEQFLGNARRDAPTMFWDFPEDTHWNRDSHRLAAEIISGHVIRHGLLP